MRAAQRREGEPTAAAARARSERGTNRGGGDPAGRAQAEGAQPKASPAEDAPQAGEPRARSAAGGRSKRSRRGGGRQRSEAQQPGAGAASKSDDRATGGPPRPASGDTFFAAFAELCGAAAAGRRPPKANSRGGEAKPPRDVRQAEQRRGRRSRPQRSYSFSRADGALSASLALARAGVLLRSYHGACEGLLSPYTSYLI